MKNINEQIKLKEAELTKLKEEQKQQESNIDIKSLKWIKVKGVNFDITKPIVWTKTYKEIPILESLELIDIRDLFSILDEEDNLKKMGIKKDTYNIFWCKQLKIDKKKYFSRRLCRGRGELGSGDDYLLSSYEAGRVIFVRKIK